jgi:hypothetical protein
LVGSSQPHYVVRVINIHASIPFAFSSSVSAVFLYGATEIANCAESRKPKGGHPSRHATPITTRPSGSEGTVPRALRRLERLRED